MRTRILFTIVLAAVCALLLAQTTDLSITDLGRHLKNGQVLLDARVDVLYRNFYSYIQFNFPFINHHWLSGVVFYLIWQFFGFGGLTILYMLLVTSSVLLMFEVARREAPWEIAAALALLAAPIIVWRTDVRPEAFTYLLIALTYAILNGWHSGTLHPRSLYLLPAITLLWVNLHIGFVLQFLLLGMFFLKAPNRRREILTITGVCAAAGLLNPNWIHGLLYPLNIFRNYGYDVAENQSIMAQAERGLGGAFEYRLFEFLLALAAGSFLLRWFKTKPQSPSRLPEALLLGSAGVLAVFAVRNLPVFALLMIPVVAGNLRDVAVPRLVALAGVAGGLLCGWWQFEDKRAHFGIGVPPGVNATAQFLKDRNITGPIFNDIDIGGYLIFHMGGSSDPDVVFVDGRPEAYPEDFIKNSYLAGLSEEKRWTELDSETHFNAIVFSLQDAFPAVEHFLLTRAWDPAWAPVYADTYSLVFVKRNERNADTIRQFEIPKERFRRP